MTTNDTVHKAFDSISSTGLAPAHRIFCMVPGAKDRHARYQATTDWRIVTCKACLMVEEPKPEEGE